MASGSQTGLNDIPRCRSSQSVSSSRRSASLKEAKENETINGHLFSLMQATNVSIDYDVFCVLVNLLRNGVDADNLYVCLNQFRSRSRLLHSTRSRKVMEAKIGDKPKASKKMDQMEVMTYPDANETTDREKAI